MLAELISNAEYNVFSDLSLRGSKMVNHTIDTATVKRLVEAHALRGAAIIGQPGGWSVLLKYGTEERPLGIQRADKPRLWRSLDTCVGYLRDELHIVKVDLLDATRHDADVALSGKSRPDASGRAYDEERINAFAEASAMTQEELMQAKARWDA